MKLDQKDTKMVGEKNEEIFEGGKKGFRLSIRWNENNQEYECYKLYFDTNQEEILFNSKELNEVLKRSCELSNFYADSLANDSTQDPD